ncbi:MAG: LCP family protein [Chloroflexota bacterium]|nr:LCP family protein [Chloroflexota bacterium]
MRNRAAAVGQRSPFAAAFLSFVFPGLGQAFAGLYVRALAFAVVPILVLALAAGTLTDASARNHLLANLASPTVLLIALALNIALLLYRGFAVIDAYRAALAVSRGAREGRRPRAPASVHLFSLAGLMAILLVMALGHAAVARYNLLAYDLITGISGEGGELAVPSATGPTPPLTAGRAASPIPTAPRLPWNGKERLNVLLIGTDSRPERAGHYFTDTLIVASVDPTTGQVAMFSLPRDTIHVPLPESWPAHSFYPGGVFPEKINALFIRAVGAPALFPGEGRQRGYTALKGAVGELYGIDIKYFVEVDFRGFRRVIDTLGGLIVDVQVPVSDDHYPSDDGRGYLNLYIPAGIQQMDGVKALSYARARNKTSDFDRAARQQRLILSLRRQADLPNLLAPGRLQALVAALKQAVRTDIPPELFPRLITLAQDSDLANARSLVFVPPLYQRECLSCYSLTPKVEAIRRAVREALTAGAAAGVSRDRLAREGARIMVLNGSGKRQQATRAADYLSSLGLAAEVPTASGGRADRLTYQDAVVTVYNGAEGRIPETVRVLEQTFGVRAVTKSDPAIRVDVIVITGARTPDLKP